MRFLWWMAMGKRSHMTAQANGSRDIHYNVLAYSVVRTESDNRWRPQSASQLYVATRAPQAFTIGFEHPGGVCCYHMVLGDVAGHPMVKPYGAAAA